MHSSRSGQASVRNTRASKSRSDAMSPLSTVQIGMTATPGRTGGLDRYFSDLVRALPSVDVAARALVVGDGPDTFGPQPLMRSVAPGTVGMLQRWKALRQSVRSELRDGDLVVTHFAPYAFPVLDLVRAHPMVVHFHGPWALEKASEGAGGLQTRARRLLERTVYRRGAHVIVLTNAYGEILQREYRVAPERVHVVPGGVDLERFSAAGRRVDARQRLALPSDRPIVVTARRLVPSKGVQNLIDAIGEVRRRIPDVLLAIAGGGPLANDLQRLVRERDLAANVVFLGYVGAQLPDVFRAADLSVVPSASLEGFGLVVLESLAAGTPVLVTPVGGLPEVVRDLDAALIVDGVDAPTLARGIEAALTGATPMPNETLCRAYAERFSWHAIALRVRDVYMLAQ